MNDSLEGGGFFGSSNSFAGVIKKTKKSEASLIKNYESMEQATRDYNKSFKEHLSNLVKLDDYANFSGMKNLFQKVIMKDVITQGAKVDTSMPLLFRNYHIEDEPTPSAFRREHILRQVQYILATSFAGREHMLIKYMSVELGKSQFILHITTIENLKKSRTLDHSGYVIDAGGTRAALKDILSATKKNLKRRTALVEIGRGSDSGTSSRRKRTQKSYGMSSASSLLKSKTRSRSRSHSSIDNNNSGFDTNRLDIGSSKESIKSLAKKKREPSNKLTSMIDLKSMKVSSKQSKASIYKRPSEKRPPVATLPAPGQAAPGQAAPGQSPIAPAPLLPGAAPPTIMTGDFAAKKQEILGVPVQPMPSPFQPIPGQVQEQQQQVAPGYQPAPGQQPHQQKIMCKDHTDEGTCKSHAECFWDAKWNSCKFNRLRNGAPSFGTPGTPGGFPKPQQAFPNQFAPVQSVQPPIDINI
jgi:hypothetical protein